MSIPKFAIKRSNLTWFLLLTLLIGGFVSFMQLGKKEDSTFIIKSAAIVTSYPGATPLEVEQLITEPIEREVQSMSGVYKVTSDSQFGLSRIIVELDPSTPPEITSQRWDDLRRKVLNISPMLPAGAVVSVNDDYGDLYGIYFALSADDGISFTTLRDWAERIKTRVVTIDGVEKVTLFGEQSPVVNLYISISRLANFSIRPEQVVATIARQNSVVGSGEKQAGQMRIRIYEDGSYSSLEDIEDQLLIASDGKQYRLGDVAEVERSYANPPISLMRVNGRRAIGIGISTDGDKDVVKSGAMIREAIDTIIDQMPRGIDLEVLYPEDKIAYEATMSFLLNLVESVAIVIFTIMLIMGLRSGLLIGSSLIFSIGGTLLIMQFIGEGLNRTSLAGFIIAMGMLVDNSIVVTDNAQNLIKRGSKPADAVIPAADKPKWGLLGATLIAIFSFLPLYLAPNAVAEIVKPLFVVLAISLLLSWMLALTQTPLFGSFLLRGSSEVVDPYDKPMYRMIDRVLESIIKYRWWVVVASIALFIGSLQIMARMPQNFFPSLDKPYFRADVILPEGYSIEATSENLLKIEEWLLDQKEVKNVSITAGGTPPRYYLASSAISLMPNFGNILVELYDSGQSAAMERRFNKYVTENYPDVWLRSSLFKLSPVPDASIEFGFIGESVDTLLMLAAEAEAIMWRNADAINIRNSWGNRVPVWKPLYSQTRGQRVGISRSDLASGLTIATSGYRMGDFREGDQLLPILLKDANIESYNLSNLQTLPIFSPSGGLRSVEQSSSGFDLAFEPSVIKRFNRQRVIKAQCDPGIGVNTKRLYGELLNQVIDEIKIPNGYTFRIFGEEESQAESNDALAANMPLAMVLIFITLLLLFGNYRDPAIILLLTPLIFIGVVMGLAISGKLLNFFALLGLLG
ncbi:MAG: efflux RND transporter permease subunit, partial [Rikenellaceae bacterium]